MNNYLSKYLAQINIYNFLSLKKEIQLTNDALKGNLHARGEIIQAHLKMVIPIAKKYAGSNINIEDLISEGNLALIFAADHFNPNKGARFSTYAKQWVIEFIKRRVYKEMYPINVPFKKAKELQKNKEEYAQIINSLKNPVRLSFNTNSNLENNYKNIYNNIIDNRDRPETILENRELKNIINNKVKYILTEQELTVFNQRIFTLTQKTYKEISTKMNVSLETVRNLEKKGLAKVKRQLKKELVYFI